MMEGFNPNEYRTNLAKELREKGQIDESNPIKILTEAEKTEEYKVAREVKIAKHKAIKKYGEKTLKRKIQK